jgi:hypothetical protein
VVALRIDVHRFIGSVRTASENPGLQIPASGTDFEHSMPVTEVPMENLPATLDEGQLKDVTEPSGDCPAVRVLQRPRVLIPGTHWRLHP